MSRVILYCLLSMLLLFLTGWDAYAGAYEADAGGKAIFGGSSLEDRTPKLTGQITAQFGSAETKS